MPTRVYRVCRAIHARLDGAGAKLVGGRWNSAGQAVVYMSESVSLAVLENLVHLSKQDFPRGYVTVTAEIPDHVAILTEEELRQKTHGASRKMLGNQWIESNLSAVLRVRSIVVPAERNFLLNPAHPHFSKISVAATKPFTFDARLFR